MSEQSIKNQPTRHPLFQRLLDADEDLPENLKAELLAHIDELRETLHAVVADEDMLEEDSPGGGFAPGHALEVLVADGDTTIIESALDVFLTLVPEYILYSRFIHLLQEFGAAIVEPILARADEVDEELLWGLGEILVESGVRDDRIFAFVERTVRAEPNAAHLFRGYGDERAVAILQDVFRTIRTERGEHLMANQAMVEVEDALTELGGKLNPRQQARFDRVMAHRDALTKRYREQMSRSETLADQAPKLGRNAPCWCGSGKKYKRCHWATDRSNS